MTSDADRVLDAIDDTITAAEEAAGGYTHWDGWSPDAARDMILRVITELAPTIPPPKVTP